MPHVPDRHTDHDVALVAASISDDLTAAERATVTDLLAACAECRELATDLRALVAATAALPVPPRRRDYRLTPDQAARLRPSGVRGLLAALGSRRFSFAAPLGTAVATLGIVGLLVAALPGPLAIGGAAMAPMPEVGAPEMAAPAPAAPDPAAAPDEGGSGAASEGDGGVGGDATLTQPMTTSESNAPFVGRVGSEEDTQAAERAPTGQSGGGDASTAAPAESAFGRDGTLLAVSSIALAVGLLLITLRWAGRRIVRGA